MYKYLDDILGGLLITLALFISFLAVFWIAFSLDAHFLATGFFALFLTCFPFMLLLSEMIDGYSTRSLQSLLPTWIIENALIAFFTVSMVLVVISAFIMHQAKVHFGDELAFIHYYQGLTETNQQQQAIHPTVHRTMRLHKVFVEWPVLTQILLSLFPPCLLWFNRAHLFILIYYWSVTRFDPLPHNALWLISVMLLWGLCVVSVASAVLVLSMARDGKWQWRVWWYSAGLGGVWILIWAVWTAESSLHIEGWLDASLYMYHALFLSILYTSCAWILSLATTYLLLTEISGPLEGSLFFDDEDDNVYGLEKSVTVQM